jgi:hypothetical protein
MPSKNSAKASRHAERSWTCACGRTIQGNGGKTSHQRACREYKEGKLASMKRSVAKWDKKGDPLQGTIREKWEGEIKELERELS